MSRPKKKPSFKKLCAIYGIDPAKSDAGERLLNAARAEDENGEKKKGGAPTKWTGLTAADFEIDAAIAGSRFSMKHGREPNKTRLAKEIKRLFPDKYKKSTPGKHSANTVIRPPSQNQGR